MWGWAEKIGEHFGLRGFSAAGRDRTTHDQFPVTESKINEDLVADLKTLRARTLQEIKDNPFLAGVVETHKMDVVGPNGPSLQFTTDDDVYNSLMEELWQEWWAAPDIAGVLSGADMLQQDVGMLWGCGEFLSQITSEPNSNTRLSLRLAQIHPRRLDDPIGAAMSQDIVLGVRRNREGKPIGYFITDFDADEGQRLALPGQRELSAEVIIHGFRQQEPGQVRGYPLAAPALRVIRDLRDYDASVLRAARIVAEMSVLLYTDHPDVTPLKVNETVDFQPNVIRTVVPGWKPMQVKAEQPATAYVDFRCERLREMGRPVNMPMMMVRLDSKDHNYSSARFDGQIYNRGVKTLQQWISRVKLDRCVREVIKEGQFATRRRPPKRVTWAWTWPVAPHVDPQKEARAIEVMLKLGLISEIEACAMNGNDYETVQKNIARAREIRKENGNDSADVLTDEQKAQAARAIMEILGAKDGVSKVEGSLVL